MKCYLKLFLINKNKNTFKIEGKEYKFDKKASDFVFYWNLISLLISNSLIYLLFDKYNILFALLFFSIMFLIGGILFTVKEKNWIH